MNVYWHDFIYNERILACIYISLYNECIYYIYTGNRKFILAIYNDHNQILAVVNVAIIIYWYILAIMAIYWQSYTGHRLIISLLYGSTIIY